MRWCQALVFVVVIASKTSGDSSVAGSIARPAAAEKEDPTRHHLLSLLVDFLFKIVEDNELSVPKPPPIDGSLSIMTWNILAPLWIDIETLKASGVVDLNLLNNEIRLKLVIQNIKEESPDIVVLQEVEEETYETIRQLLSAVYDPVAFAFNVKEYWESFVPEGKKYVNNGVATFYKRKKLSLFTHNIFETSDQGSVALASVFLQIGKGPADEVHGEPIIVLTCHLEAGVTIQESSVRVAQGTIIGNEGKRISDDIIKKFPGSQPVIIIAGDINSVNPFPGFSSFIQQGYLDAVEEIEDSTKQTYFYEQPVPLPTGNSVTGLRLDHVFIRKSDNDAGRIQLLSAEIPDIKSDEFTEKSYMSKVAKIVMGKLRVANNRKFWQIIRGSSFSTLLEVATDDVDSDHNVNRVLRHGSDHLPVLVTFKM